MVPIVLPALIHRRWALVDLDARARAFVGGARPNPLLDPGTCQGFVDGVARDLGVDHTWGGYLEDRSSLWAGHYHDPGTMLHLGVDVNAPAGTVVAAPAACRVARVVRDPDQGGGWGGVAYFELDVPYEGASHFLYGHLAHASLPEAGRRYAAGELVAMLGTPSENGGWFPHLHVQCLSPDAVAAHWPRLEAIDGYGPNGLAPRPDMPDPTRLVAGLHA